MSSCPCVFQGEELFADYGKWYWAGNGGGERLSDERLQGVYDGLNASGDTAKLSVDRETEGSPHE